MPLSLRDRIGRIREWRGAPVREAPSAADARGANYGRSSGIAIGVALLFAILSPVGTDRLSAPGRLVYWLAMLLGGSAIGVTIARHLYRRPRIARHPLLGSLATGLLLTPPISILAALANRLAFGYPLDSAAHWLGNLPAVFGLSCGLALVNLWAVTGARARAEAAAPPEPSAPADRGGAGEAVFRARLPDGFRTADLWALEAEDHYLRVHMSSGSTLILMRLSDAMAALARIDGAQTHRSWWVARSAASRIETGGGRAALILPDGTKAPVSRSFFRELKRRGWL